MLRARLVFISACTLAGILLCTQPASAAGGDPPALAVVDGSAHGKPDLVIADDFANSILRLLNTYIPGSDGSACTPAAFLGD